MDSRLRGNDGNLRQALRVMTRWAWVRRRVGSYATASVMGKRRLSCKKTIFGIFFATSAHLLRLLRSAPVPVPAPSLLRLLANGWLFQGGGENLCHFYRIKAVLLAAKLAAYFDLALLGDDAVGFFLP